ncbi:MAG: endonuclease/exonuclease/phosphatase family protein [Actinobacteria bacterium]|nr:endonuclease/exonuclease/phosphatase family protein [Actinomycetota bacterium]
MRIASFNVESLFDRAKALDPHDWAAGRQALEDHVRINRLLGEPEYTEAVKKEIKALLRTLGLEQKDDGGTYARLRQNRGRLLKRPKGGGLEVIASGRDDWIGWVELETEPVNELATRHTAMVMRDVDAHVMAVIEADNRIALRDFSAILLRQVGATPFEHVMLIDGNDDRGIDVGMLTRKGHEIIGVRSHVDDGEGQTRIFSRDCPEYTIRTPSGDQVVLLVNHLKSKGYGKQKDNNARRERQAAEVAKIYRRLRDEGQRNVAVVGDLNDTPDSRPLKPLAEDTDLRDVSEHPTFVSDGRPGTYAGGSKSNKLDYILLSPALFKKVTSATVFRKGVWGGKHGTLFEHYPTMTKASEAASDHAAIYADIAGL